MPNFCLYGWKNNDWDRWFYIGVGTRQRAKERNKRSKWFREIVSAYNCEMKIFQEFPEGADDKFIQSCERALKETLRGLGEPIFDGENDHRESVMRGIAIAKAEGKYKGRKPIEIDKDLFAEQYRMWKNGETAPKFMCKKLGVSHATLYRKIEQYEKEVGIRKE